MLFWSIVSHSLFSTVCLRWVGGQSRGVPLNVHTHVEVKGGLYDSSGHMSFDQKNPLTPDASPSGHAQCCNSGLARRSPHTLF